MHIQNGCNLTLSMLAVPCLLLAEEKPLPLESSAERAVHVSNEKPEQVKQARTKLDQLIEEFSSLNSKTSLEWMKNEIRALRTEAQELQKNLKDLNPAHLKTIADLQLKKSLISEFLDLYYEIQAKPAEFNQLLKGESENGSDFSLADFKISLKTERTIASASAEIDSILKSLSAGPGTSPFYEWIAESNKKLSALKSSAAELAGNLDNLAFRKSDHTERTLEKVRSIVKSAPWLIAGTAILYFGFVVIRELSKAFGNSAERNKTQTKKDLTRTSERIRLKQVQSRNSLK